MIRKNTRKYKRNYRHKRVRKKISGTVDVPRVSVFKSSRHIYAQVIDDDNQITICSASTLTPEVVGQFGDKNLKKVDKANIVGKYLGDLMLQNNVKEIRFDRGGYPYHGRVKALAEGIREKGIRF